MMAAKMLKPCIRLDVMSYHIVLIAKNIIVLKKNENHNQPMAFTGPRTGGRKQASNTVRTNQTARYVASQQDLFITR